MPREPADTETTGYEIHFTRWEVFTETKKDTERCLLANELPGTINYAHLLGDGQVEYKLSKVFLHREQESTPSCCF